jgi:hypothetical protein
LEVGLVTLDGAEGTGAALADFIWRMTDKSAGLERLTIVTALVTMSLPPKKTESIRKAGVVGRVF